jgi:hypothetical protein
MNRISIDFQKIYFARQQGGDNKVVIIFKVNFIAAG